MSSATPLDTRAAHRYFSADCFNRAWALIEKPDRSPEDNRQMLLLAQASLWHWTQRDDCTDQNLSIGYWQLSRICALLGDHKAAIQYGDLCLHHSQGQPPFYLGYAHESLARAAQLSGDTLRAAQHLNEARRLLAEITDAADRTSLENDVNSIQAIDHESKLAP
jgi:hypothetical protein